MEDHLMNPDTGTYEREELIKEYAAEYELTEQEATRRILATENAVRIEGTEEQVKNISQAIQRNREVDLENLNRIKREIEKRERRHQ
jgi:hypothetical protein